MKTAKEQENNNRDKDILASIDEMIEDQKRELAYAVNDRIMRIVPRANLNTLAVVRTLVIADKERQQAEKEKMIAKLRSEAEIIYDLPNCHAIQLSDAIAIIKGKREEAEQ